MIDYPSWICRRRQEGHPSLARKDKPPLDHEQMHSVLDFTIISSIEKCTFVLLGLADHMPLDREERIMLDQGEHPDLASEEDLILSNRWRRASLNPITWRSWVRSADIAINALAAWLRKRASEIVMAGVGAAWHAALRTSLMFL